MMRKVFPRVYCIPATKAPIVAVFRRGPTSWSHIGRWNVEKRSYEAGAWFRGRIFPRRSDLSPDGKFLCYFAHKAGSSPREEAYMAISKLPWMAALHVFGECGTWTRGYCFTEDLSGRPAEFPIPYGVRPMEVVQFATERRRGWEETADCPPRDPADVWDEWRNVRLQKQQPGGERLLGLESLGRAGGECGVNQAVDGMCVRYWLTNGDQVHALTQVQWADWDSEGNLLVATRSGRLKILQFNGSAVDVLFEKDLACFKPSPSRAPDWACLW